MLALLAPSCSAFTTVSAVRAPTVVRGTHIRCITLDEVKSDSGVTVMPIPGGYFDPAGLLGSQAQINAHYSHYKEVEIKHARVAMLAAVGFVVGEQFHPLFGGDIDVPSYLAFQQTPLQAFWPAVVLAIGAFETLTSIPAFDKPVNGEPESNWKIRADHIPGDAGLFGGAKMAVEDPKKFKDMQTKEINNGRLAMMGIAGMVAQELVTGAKLF